MSHNQNYSKFSQSKQSVNLEEIFPDTENKESKAVDNEVVELSTEIEPLIGFVDDCERLRVRKESNVDSEELCILDKMSEVVVDLDNSTDYFYKVKTSEGVEGYCMKKFIKIK